MPTDATTATPQLKTYEGARLERLARTGNAAMAAKRMRNTVANCLDQLDRTAKLLQLACELNLEAEIERLAETCRDLSASAEAWGDDARLFEAQAAAQAAARRR